METVNKTLVNSLNSQVGEENSFEKIGKNRKLAKLLGAKLFLSYDWNLFAKPTYSLSEIQKTLNDSGIKDSAQSFVKEDLRINSEWEDNYSFEKVADSTGIEMYALSYSREPRPTSYDDFRTG
jgi:hypothetical protein